MSSKVEFSEGLKAVLSRYCEYRNWYTVAPQTAEAARELINRAGSVEDAIRGIKWFFTSRYCDDWVKENRPNLGLQFLAQHWDRFEIAQGEYKPRSRYYGTVNEYAIMRG